MEAAIERDDSAPPASSALARVLIIDDDPMVVRAIATVFRNTYVVSTAAGGQEGLDLARSELPDLILLDVEMPGVDGYEVCRQLKEREETRDIPVIFVTVHQDPACEQRCLESGAVDFIAKPFNAAVLRARVNAHLALSRQLQERRQLRSSVERLSRELDQLRRDVSGL